jgi:hypothetical protein
MGLDPGLRRRTLLATAAAGLAGALAGCAHANAALTMSPADTETVVDGYTRSFPEGRERDLLASAAENGSATSEGTRPQIDDARPYEYDGAFYAVRVTEVAELEGTRVTVEIDYATAANLEGVPLDAFPEHDRRLLEGLFPPEEDQNQGSDMGGGAVYTPEEADASRLVNEEIEAIRYEGAAYPVTVETRPASRYRYRYETEQVAPDAETLVARLREQHLFTLSGLSEAEREIVEQATGDGYYAGSANEAFTSLARRFREHEALDEDRSNYLVRYEGVDYWADLYAPFVDEA